MREQKGNNSFSFYLFLLFLVVHQILCSRLGKISIIDKVEEIVVAAQQWTKAICRTTLFMVLCISVFYSLGLLSLVFLIINHNKDTFRLEGFNSTYNFNVRIKLAYNWDKCPTKWPYLNSINVLVKVALHHRMEICHGPARTYLGNWQGKGANKLISKNIFYFLTVGNLGHHNAPQFHT